MCPCRIPHRFPQSSGFEVMDPNLGPLTGPGLARTRSKCSTHRPSWAAGRASGAETSHVEIRHFAQLHFAQNFLTFQTQHLELTYIWICPKLGTQNGHISGENDWGFGAPYQTDPSVNCIQLSHLAAAFDPSAQGRTNMSKSDPGLPILILSHTPNPYMFPSMWFHPLLNHAFWGVLGGMG